LDEDHSGSTSPPFDLEEAADKIDNLLRPPDEGSRYTFDALDSGQRAQLRRIDRDNPFTPALWHVLFEIDHDEAPGWWKHRENAAESEWERRWAVLCSAMTRCQGQHDDDTSLGVALADAAWAEMRFVRLMEARGRELEDQVRYMAQYLASTGESLDWSDAGKLLFFQNGDAAQNIRVGISRSYYGRRQVLEQEGGETEQ
jgi:hypothetical protein